MAPFLSCKGRLQRELRLVFLCAHDGSRARCGPKGLGFMLFSDSALLKKLRPALKLSLALVRVLAGAAGVSEVAASAAGALKDRDLPETLVCAHLCVCVRRVFQPMEGCEPYA
jgi:hypothetical protein